MNIYSVFFYTNRVCPHPTRKWSSWCRIHPFRVSNSPPERPYLLLHQSNINMCVHLVGSVKRDGDDDDDDGNRNDTTSSSIRHRADQHRIHAVLRVRLAAFYSRFECRIFVASHSSWSSIVCGCCFLLGLFCCIDIEWVDVKAPRSMCVDYLITGPLAHQKTTAIWA